MDVTYAANLIRSWIARLESAMDEKMRREVLEENAIRLAAQRGREEWAEGRSLDECPYPSEGAMRTAWMREWLSADGAGLHTALTEMLSSGAGATGPTLVGTPSLADSKIRELAIEMAQELDVSVQRAEQAIRNLLARGLISETKE